MGSKEYFAVRESIAGRRMAFAIAQPGWQPK